MFGIITLLFIWNRHLPIWITRILSAMKVSFIFHYEVASSWLKEAILSYYPTTSLSDFSHHFSCDISQLTLDGMSDWIGHLVITNHQSLISIRISKSSAKHLLSLKISNNPRLKTIETKDFGCTYIQHLEISGILKYCWMIWTS